MRPTNESSLDRDLRIVLGIVFTILAIFYLPPVFGIVSGVLAAIMFITSAIGFCPLYAVLGINTAASQK